jgi:uncharacterized protein involved in propanediol utilization
MRETDLVRSCVYAKIGELVQGKLTPTEDFIIPGITSSKFCTKTFIYNIEGNSLFDIRAFVFPVIFVYLKMKDGLELDEIPQDQINDISIVKDFVYAKLKNVSVVQNTNIPEGKGLSSVPTDSMSMLLALNKFHKTKFDKSVLYKMCSKICPTDPVLDKEISLIFNPISGEKVFNLIPKAFGVIYFDSDAEKQFDAKEVFSQFNYTSADYVVFNEILELFQNGTFLNDNAMVFKAITLSAKLNQAALPKPKFDLLLDFATNHKHEMGVFVGHTGTVMGLVMEVPLINKVFQKVSAFIEDNWDARAYYDFCEQSVIKLN